MKQNGWSLWSTGRGQRMSTVNKKGKQLWTAQSLDMCVFSKLFKTYNIVSRYCILLIHRLCNMISHGCCYRMHSRWIVDPWATTNTPAPAGANIWHTSQAALDHAGRGLEPPRGWHNFGRSYLRGWKKWTACNDFYKPWILPQHASFLHLWAKSIYVDTDVAQ